METFNDFYQAEIGKDGIIISEKVKTEFERQINTAAVELNNIKLEMNAEIKNFNTVLNSLGKDGINFIVKGNFINNAAILGVRDGIVNVGKFFGRDIGKFLKFKPWGAIKLAKGLNGLLVGVGFIMEARDQLDKYKQRQKFNKNKMEIKKFFEEQREELIKQIDSTEFYQTYFSDYDILKEELLKSKEKTNELKNYKIEFDKWFKQGEKIMLELNKL